VPSGDSIGARILRGLAWKVISQLFGQTAQIVVTVILARLLVPRDYGLAAIALVLSTLVPIFADLALGAALVQRRELTEKDKSTVFWTSLAVGSLCTVIGVALSWPIAAFYGEPDVQPLFAGLSLTFVVTALGTTQRALLNRDMDFRSLELRQMAGTGAGSVVGITAAVLGFGAWAIIGQQIAIAIVSTLLLWVLSPWRPRAVFSMHSLRTLGGFSGNVFLSRIVFYFNRNIAQLLIPRFLGAASLGIYVVGFNVMLSPLSRLAWPITEVFFPAFSRMHGETSRISDIWLRVNRIVASVTIPGILGLALVTPEFVDVVLGKRWHAAIPVIRALSWVALLQSLQTLNTGILQAQNRTGALFRFSALALIANLTAITVGLHWGIVGVATGFAISSTLVEPYLTWITCRTLGLSALTLPRGLFGVVQATLAMAACILAMRILILPSDLPHGVTLSVLVLTGFLSYLPLCAWRAPEVRREVVSLIRRRRRSTSVDIEPQPASL
jgi:O-antigen/teichoic acid export membrane protein